MQDTERWRFGKAGTGDSHPRMTPTNANGVASTPSTDNLCTGNRIDETPNPPHSRRMRKRDLGQPLTESKIDPVQRILMWLCAEKRLAAGVSQVELAELVRAQATNPSKIANDSISRWERGVRWLESSRTVIIAYAGLAGMTAPQLWDEAVQLSDAGYDLPALATACRTLDEVVARLAALRELSK